ncbi:MAG: Fur family transcriptional regulator [Verrucomicrobiales bacterium]|nr:Fur family transcriptional regulator [Verrucomicrobiales bacterium]|tara:strand:+ start:5945 stop:6418 length:474 start_codon:yes stop_codon:yes gene_type:complete
MAKTTKQNKTENDERLNERLAHSGMRLTPQRRHVHEVLREKMDHPTADQVFLRAKETMPEISMATVYNSLDALVSCGLVRQVNADRGATRYCHNMQPHSHFYCDECGSVHDILQTVSPDDANFRMPRGFRLENIETTIHGKCPECSSSKKPRSNQIL